MALICTSPPMVEPVSITELKDMLRLDHSDYSQDDVLTTLAIAARSWCETISQRRFVQQSWSLYMDFFPGYIDLKLAGQRVSSPFVSGSNAVLVGIRYAIVLPYPPVQTLNTFTYTAANGFVTSMITQPIDIASVTNTSGQPVKIETTTPHGLQTGASITIAGNATLTGILNNQSQYSVVEYDPYTLILNGFLGTGATIPSTGSITGYNFVQDVLSQPARLMPVFGSMWPVAMVISNALEVNYTLGYASPVLVTVQAGNGIIGNATFTANNVGKPISIPGAGKHGGTLNTIIASVDGSGNATVRDLPSKTFATPQTGLVVNYGSPAHWELIRSAIKFLVNAWFINRVPSFDKDQRDCVAAILGPVRDMRL